MGRRGGKPATNRLSYGADLAMDISSDSAITALSRQVTIFKKKRYRFL
jgi:hypothetical protein